MIICPVCDAEIDLDEDELEEGDTLSCEECGAELRVAGTDPLELEPVEDEEDEDLDYDEDEEEDDWR